MQATPSIRFVPPLQWRDVYQEAELYKAAVRVYTKPLFQWRKALATSTDGKTLYDLAGRGLRGLEAIHRALQREAFQFRPAVALSYNFNGKHRTLYVAPWEERIVDLLLYRLLSCSLRGWFSPNSYAYRDRDYGLDRCQTRIAAVLRSARTPLYLVKRDIVDYFAAINHDLLLDKLASLANPADYLFRLLEQRVRFLYQEGENIRKATCGVPFGTAIACLFANIYLTELDRQIESLPHINYFRYADDILVLSPDRETAGLAAEHLELTLLRLELRTKASHGANLLISRHPAADFRFAPAGDFRHLGLLFRAGGKVSLSRDKLRKIQNLFRFAFRRGRRRWQKIDDSDARAQALVTIASEAIGKGVRNVAILDYYLKHVDEEKQLRMLDRWLAEEILSRVFRGHKRGHFRRIPFRRLRALGLPSLVHRRRLICRGRIDSPFFVWQRHKATRAFRGTVARLRRCTGGAAFSPVPEAAAGKCP
ncbi:MAG TPA: reverse transcriptase domain-containing protein [Acidobacteriota bacterium]